jgi:ABC-2 type transport system ATP-binding protein
MTTVFMEHLSSAEHVVRFDNQPERILKDVSLKMAAGEAWSVSAPEHFEIRLLLEIMANIRPYEAGRCVLVERGMMRRKRLLLRHVFFVGSADMFYGTMTALEHLMLLLPHAPSAPARLDAQERLLGELLAHEMGYLALTRIDRLTPADKIALALFTAAQSGCRLVVVSLPEILPGERTLHAFAALSRTLRTRGKTLVLGTNDSGLIDAACTHSAFLAGGRVLYQGKTDTLKSAFDPVLLTLRGGGLDALSARLAPLPEGYSLEREGDALHILCRPPQAGDIEMLHKKIAQAGVVPDVIEVHRKNARNAFKEILRQHGLQDDLLP